MKRSSLLCLLLLCAFNLSAFAAEGDEPIFTDPEKAGVDYTIQGEYQGDVETDEGPKTFGAQVIALGDGEFQLVGYHGGLPGDGWLRGDESVSAEGALENGAAEFEVPDTEAVVRVSNDVLSVFVEGEKKGELKKVVRKSKTLGAKPPEGAIVLFDGSSAEHFERGKIVEDDLLAADCETKQKFGDHKLHIEFRTPFKPTARGQARGNSGVYVHNRYEVQVLDSFGLEGKNNECGGIYSIAEPAVNMCLPPLTWQTYDIDFTAAEYNDAGEKTKNARVTILHNGVVIHDDLELTHGTPGKNPEGPGPDGLYLQGHGNPVVYRNIWVVKK